MSKFKRGMLVQAISVDDFFPREMPVGSIWKVISVHGSGYGGETIAIRSDNGLGPAYTPYSCKFVPLDEIHHAPMAEPDMSLDEIHAFQDMVNGQV